MSVTSFLSSFGKDFKAVFAWLGSKQGQTTIETVETSATAVVTAINPAAGLAMSGIEALINAAMQQIVSTEAIAAAAEQQNGTGVQKSAAVVAAVAPQVSSVLQSLGVKSPTATQVQSISQVVSDSLVSIVNAFPPPAK